jgi:hypothetical protein
MPYRKSLLAAILPAILLSGCATMTPSGSEAPPDVAAAQSPMPPEIQPGQPYMGQPFVQQGTPARGNRVAQEFCGRWQRSLRLAKGSLTGCAKTQKSGSDNDFCWDMVSRWSADQSADFSRMAAALAGTGNIDLQEASRNAAEKRNARRIARAAS